jgi:hypothetical protein
MIKKLNRVICSTKTWFPCEGGECLERRNACVRGEIQFALEMEFQDHGKQGVNKKRLCMII